MKLRSRPALTRIVLLYLVFAGLWFFLSDRLLATSVHETERLHQLHTLNDLAFAALTAIALFVILRREHSAREKADVRLERHARQLTALTHMGQAVLSSLDLTVVLKKVVDEVAPFFSAKGVSVLLLEGDELVFAASHGSGAEKLIGRRIPATAGIAGEVARVGEPRQVSDHEQQSHIYREIEKFSGYHVKSLLAVPLKLGNETIGVIEAVHTLEDAFGPDDLSLLEAAAHWAIIAIGNARERKRTQRQLQESEVIAAISRQLNETVKLGQILQFIVDAARYTIPNADRAVIHLLDESHAALHAAAVASLDRLNPTDFNMRPGEGVAGQVLAEGEVINVTDTQADPRYLPLGADSHLRSLLVAPVESGTRRLGTLSVSSQSPHAFSADDERLLVTLGIQTGLAIEKAQLFETERRRAEEAVALQQVAQTLISQFNLPELLRRIVTSIATMANYQYVSVFLLEGERLILRACQGYTETVPSDLGLNEGMSGRAAVTRQPVFAPDVTLDKDYILGPGGVRSAIAVPLIHADQVLGVLLVEADALRTLDQSDFNWLINAGRQMSIAIKNTLLVSDLEKALRQEQAARAQLVQTEKLAAMGRLIASVAHELNNPVQAIQNALYLVKQERALNAQSREDLGVALAEADRMVELIARLRETYRPTTSEDFRPESLNTLVEEVQKLIGTHLRRNKVEFRFEPDPALPPVRGIRDQLKQVIINLCLNAVEAMPSGGHLMLRTEHRPDSGEAWLYIADTGIGIEAAALSNVFDPFYTTKESGTGLGLAITYEIIQRHLGQIEVTSEPRHGTTIRVRLPVELAGTARAT